MQKISVIVPVYNAQKYIERCVQSITNQTHNNLEIILVDDGSTDNSGKICDGFLDDRVIVIHQKNAGVSAARNAGLNYATGDYIGFIDADDYIEPEMYEKLLQLIAINNAEIAACNYWTVVENTFKQHHKIAITQQTFVCNGNQAIDKLYSRQGIGGFLWNKLYNKKFFKAPYELRLDENIHVCEDMLLNLQCMQLSNTIAYFEMPLYYYFIHQESVSNTISTKRNTVIDAFDKMIQQVTAEQANELRAVKAMALWSLVRMWCQSKQISEYKASKKDFLRYRKYVFLFFENLTLSEKMQILVSYISIRLACFIANNISRFKCIYRVSVEYWLSHF